MSRQYGYQVPDGVARERAKEAACYAAGVVQNGPTAHAFWLAQHGQNEDLLYALHVILTREDSLHE